MSWPTNRKLKWFDAGPLGYISVFQDGDAPDPDVTSGRRFDNSFAKGVNFFESIGQDSPFSDRPYVMMETLSNSLQDGMRMTVKIRGGGVWKSLAPGSIRGVPNDLVELYADAPDSDSLVLTPSHHLNEQSGQVRWFRGWVQDIDCDAATDTITVQCVDGLVRGDDVKLLRDGPNDIGIPIIAFNAAPDSPDYDWNVKAVSRSDSGILNIYQTGSPDNLEEYYMTVGEILQYLEAAYGPALSAQGITASNQVFEPSDLEPLDTIPAPIVLREVGFITGVKQVLKWVPDVRLSYDPRSLKFRITRILEGFNETVYETTQGAVNDPPGFPGTTGFPIQFADVGNFSTTPGDVGHHVRIVNSADTDAHVGRVTGIAGNYLYVTPPASDLFYVGSKVYPLGADTLPTVSLDADDDVPNSSLRIGQTLSGIYSAVRLFSIHTKTESRSFDWRPGYADDEGGLRPAWDRSFEEFHMPRDLGRHMDQGAGGNGIPVYGYDEGGVGGAVRIYVAYEDSAFEEDHAPNEWAGSSVVVVTANNQNYRQTNTTYGIISNSHTNNIGDTRPGMIITIDATAAQLAMLPGFITTVTAVGGESADLVYLDDDKRWGTGGSNNARSRVGALWEFTDEEVIRKASTPHQISCLNPHFKAHDGTGQGGREIGLGPDPYPVRNTIHAQGQEWEQLASGGLGSFRVFRAVARTDRVLTGGCKPGGGWIPPPLVEAELEITTTQIREARFPPPSVGHAGGGHQAYGLEREKCIAVQHWFDDDQTESYERLAQRLWNVWQGPHYRGGLTKQGIKEHAAWLDLGVRVALKHEQTPAGGGTVLDKFWAVLSRVSINFMEDTVEFEFDDAAPIGDLSSAVFEDWWLDGRGELGQLRADMVANNQTPECFKGAHRTNPSPGACTSTGRHGTRPTRPGINIQNKDNQANGGTPMSMAGSGSGKGGGTLGGRAHSTVIRDLMGNYFLIDDGEGLYPGVADSNQRFSPDPSLSPIPIFRPEELRQTSEGMWDGMTGLTPVHAVPVVFAKVTGVASSGGTTKLSTGLTSLTPSLYTGGKAILVDFDPNNPRGEGYPITGNDATDVMVADFPEEMPNLNTPLRIYARPPYPLDPADFPEGGTLCLDKSGNYAVVTATRTVVAGTLNAGGTAIELLDGGTVNWGGALAGAKGDTGDPGEPGPQGEIGPADARLVEFWNPQYCSVWPMSGGVKNYNSAGKANIKRAAAGAFGQACFESFDVPGWANNLDATNCIRLHLTYFVDTVPVSAEDIFAGVNIVWRDSDGTVHEETYWGTTYAIDTSVSVGREYSLTMTVPKAGYFDLEVDLPEIIQFNVYRNALMGSDTYGGTIDWHTMRIESGYDAP